MFCLWLRHQSFHCCVEVQEGLLFLLATLIIVFADLLCSQTPPCSQLCSQCLNGWKPFLPAGPERVTFFWCSRFCTFFKGSTTSHGFNWCFHHNLDIHSFLHVGCHPPSQLLDCLHSWTSWCHKVWPHNLSVQTPEVFLPCRNKLHLIVYHWSALSQNAKLWFLNSGLYVYVFACFVNHFR